jgi:hypothetical protein
MPFLRTLVWTVPGEIFVPRTGRFRSGGGGIRTLDTPLRGITGDSFTAVLSCSIFPLTKPESRKMCYSLSTTVHRGLVYQLV